MRCPAATFQDGNFAEQPLELDHTGLINLDSLDGHLRFTLSRLQYKSRVATANGSCPAIIVELPHTYLASRAQVSCLGDLTVRATAQVATIMNFILRSTFPISWVFHAGKPGCHSCAVSVTCRLLGFRWCSSRRCRSFHCASRPGVFCKTNCAGPLSPFPLHWCWYRRHALV